MTPAQGDIYWVETEDKRRPVLVVTRDAAIPVLNRLIVAPVTRTVRNIPTEIPLGPAQGLREPCAAACDDLRRVRPSHLGERVGQLPDARTQICRALAALADC